MIYMIVCAECSYILGTTFSVTTWQVHEGEEALYWFSLVLTVFSGFMYCVTWADLRRQAERERDQVKQP